MVLIDGSTGGVEGGGSVASWASVLWHSGSMDSGFWDDSLFEMDEESVNVEVSGISW